MVDEKPVSVFLSLPSTLRLQDGILDSAVRPPAMPINLAAITEPTIMVRFGAMNDIRVST